MPRIAWLTDLHLDFLSDEQTWHFWDSVRTARPDAVLLGGDVADAPRVIGKLRDMAAQVPCPIYFVLGNHDFYFGSIREVRQQAQELFEEVPTLHYLTATGVVELSPMLGLVGHDGWADARLGDYERSYVMMNDYRLIAELAAYEKLPRQSVLHALGDEAAAHAERWLPLAVAAYPHVVFLTHVPPLREACWHEGGISNDEWLPHFTCQALGEVLLRVMRQHPDRELTVLCGHTHSPGECRPLPNVIVHTGAAKYGAPAIQNVFEWV